MPRKVQTYSVTWQDIPVTVTYEPDWLGLCGHIQLKAEERLPLTETGYRSLYVSDESITARGGVIPFVNRLLDEAAQSHAWQLYWQERQQLCLF